MNWNDVAIVGTVAVITLVFMVILYALIEANQTSRHKRKMEERRLELEVRDTQDRGNEPQ